MKTKSAFISTLPAFAAGLLLSCLTSVQAEAVKTGPPEPNATVETSEKAITATGTVFSVEPEVLSVVMKDSPTPVRFFYNISTPFVDEEGKVIPMELVRPDLPLTVDYAMDGEKMIARKVVITRSMVAGDANEKPYVKRVELAEAKVREAALAAETQMNVPQTLMGTLSTVEQTISLVPRGESKPVTCIINNSTRYVNIAGEPVSSSLLMSGMPITVNTVQDGSRVIAQEIIVRGNPATLTGEAAMAQGSRADEKSQNKPGTAAGGAGAGGKGQPTPSVTPPAPSAR